MRVGTMLAIFVSLLMLATTAPGVAAEEDFERVRYFPGTPVLTIGCSADPHPIVPVGTDPWQDNPDGWLLSGQPECGVSDAYNAYRDLEGEPRERTGIGGGYWQVHPSDIGREITVNSDDEVFGEGQSYIVLMLPHGEDVEGCGPQSGTFEDPNDPGWHWPEPRPVYVWAKVDVIGFDADTGLCFSSTGDLEADWTS